MTITRLTSHSDHWQLEQCAALYTAFMRELAMSDGDFYSYLTRHLPDQNLCVLIALEGHTVIGYAIAFNVPEHPHIPCTKPAGYFTHCYILPDYRKQGVGKELFAAIKQWFEVLGVTAIFLHAANDGARRYWEQHGFGTPCIRLKLELHQ